MFIVESENVSSEANGGAKVFFFPDENLTAKDNGKPLPQVTADLGDVTYLSNKSSDTDEEFCFLGDEAGIGVTVSRVLSVYALSFVASLLFTIMQKF